MPDRAVFLDLSPLDQGDLDLAPLRSAFDELVCHDLSTPEQIVERLRGAQVAVVNKVALDAQTLAACPELKLILVSATGVNNIDLQAARERGIAVSAAPRLRLVTHLDVSAEQIERVIRAFAAFRSH